MTLRSREDLSSARSKTCRYLQAISMAEGLGTAPDTKHAKILRMNPGADQRTEIPVDLKTILQGKGQDVPLQGNDILFVPDSTGRKIALRALEAAIQTGTGCCDLSPVMVLHTRENAHLGYVNLSHRAERQVINV